jgi:hypothetical protein
VRHNADYRSLPKEAVGQSPPSLGRHQANSSAPALGSGRQELAPCGLEIGPRLVERRRGAALMFAGMGSRIKPATPAPRVGIGWITRADRHRCDAHIAVVDQPGLLRASGLRRRVRAGMPYDSPIGLRVKPL